MNFAHSLAAKGNIISMEPTLHLNSELMLGRKILPVRISPDDHTATSGAICARAILDYYGLFGEQTIDTMRHTFVHPLEGGGADVHPERMAAFLRGEGIDVEGGEDGTLEILCDALDGGIPVLTLTSMEGGGWRLIVGYESVDCGCGTSIEKILIAESILPTAHPEALPQNSIPHDPHVFLNHWFEHHLFDHPYSRFYLLPSLRGFNL
jgi:hypothetical protein